MVLCALGSPGDAQETEILGLDATRNAAQLMGARPYVVAAADSVLEVIRDKVRGLCSRAISFVRNRALWTGRQTTEKSVLRVPQIQSIDKWFTGITHWMPETQREKIRGHQSV